MKSYRKEQRRRKIKRNGMGQVQGLGGGNREGTYTTR